MKFGLSGLTAGAFLLALSAAPAAHAVAFQPPPPSNSPKTLNVRVIQLCDDNGNACASLGPTGNSYFAAETNAIWAQANISVNFTFGGKLNSTENMNIETEDELFGFLSESYSSVTMYLIHTLVGGAYGFGNEGSGNLVVAMDSVMSFNGGAGRLDTIAHELGHNLLPYDWTGNVEGHSTINSELMAPGSSRFSPTGISQIAPNGPGYDLLNSTQIAQARSSTLLTVTPVPEPGEWAMMAAGLGVVGFVARRKRATA